MSAYLWGGILTLPDPSDDLEQRALRLQSRGLDVVPLGRAKTPVSENRRSGPDVSRVHNGQCRGRGVPEQVGVHGLSLIHI